MRDLKSFPDAHLRIFERPIVPKATEIQTVYLVGICGTGMGSLAGLFQEAGYTVTGSDANVYPPMSTRLAEMNIHVFKGFNKNHLTPPPDLIVVGNACTPIHPEASFARENKLVQQSFPEALAHFFIEGKRALVVAGTHGKTTTSGMMIHVFQAAQKQPSFLVGGVMVNTNSSYKVGKGNHFIVEGDEYDSAYFDKRPKFLHYKPTSAIVTSMEFDHADIYEDWEMYQEAFMMFAKTVSPEGLLVLCGDDEHVANLVQYTPARVCLYGLENPENHITASNWRAVEGGQVFVLVKEEKAITEIFLPMSGKHNLMNALAVCAIALDEGLTPQEIADGFKTFKGLKRRQEIRGIEKDIIVIDDFAHHPTAVKATVAAIRERWSSRRLVAVFEPRSNSSRRKVFEEAYAKAFYQANAVFLSAPPLRHNDNPDDFMDVNTVTDHINQAGIPTQHFPNADTLLPVLLETVQPNDVVLIMSNGGFGNIHQRLLETLKEG